MVTHQEMRVVARLFSNVLRVNNRYLCGRHLSGNLLKLLACKMENEHI